MSDRFWSIAHVYMATYSTEICIVTALFLGAAIGFWRGFDHGKEKGHGEGFELGYEVGHREGMWDQPKPKRDAKGRYAK